MTKFEDEKRKLDKQELNEDRERLDKDMHEKTHSTKNDSFSKDRTDATPHDIDTHMQANPSASGEGHGAIDQESLPRSTPGWKILIQEVIHDKLALFSFIILVVITSYVFGLTLFLKQSEIVFVDLFAINEPPGDTFRLGTDYGGRDVFGQLIIGTRNSLAIGFLVTGISVGFGVVYGVVAGYFGGHIDNIMMRIVDFFMVLPFLMVIIVYVTISPDYDIFSFSLIMSAFLWVGTARLIRSVAIQEKELDYINASRTLGSSHIKIIFTQLLPNLVGIIIVNATLNLAGNIGIESGLSFIGFGFPEDTPSLGTLMSYATQTQTLRHRPWIWAPAAILILVLMLCVRNVGEAMRRAGDARQRNA